MKKMENREIDTEVEKLLNRIEKYFPKFFNDFKDFEYANGRDAGNDFKKIYNLAKRIKKTHLKKSIKYKNVEYSKKLVKNYANSIGLEEYSICFSKKGEELKYLTTTLISAEKTRYWIRIVNKNLGINILEKSKEEKYVLYRQALSLILYRHKINKSGLSIGFEQNNSTMLNSLNVAENYYSVRDPQFMPYYNEIEKIINNF